MGVLGHLERFYVNRIYSMDFKMPSFLRNIRSITTDSSEIPTRHPSRMVIGPHGLPVMTQGYTEIGGIKYYDTIMVVGDHGQMIIKEGGR